ncbi:hypothetical protein Kpol_1045p78 [Vanderwaltozyma polyspora DSM 70294]|uniref:Histone-binding protein RBBP4-like N-terminal domain-containing protein n=1 Tax=Vanderwaltozyma polyspora (strain ATCC 22028 / DSM 70294 / BCRC 21397 / CBS 2163 / NBRC 10782 / NRRL Y-8283 / UCD 57-17) TaxID=436907 RepID=A7TI84_VANPO|nr:uncharacterized protein Kpol_1045p78 [Vanderwaltozyma polyspora DSM 70294]EDO18091.1 hypothetical protein Kpol_1045p78 [Vanderwaltozyma polyspora DSM 70294]
MEAQREQEEPLTVDQEYELWKTNVPLMYDFVSETRLTWPSLTAQWLPGSEEDTRQYMILGTHTSGEEVDYLKVAALDLPDEVVTGEANDDNRRTKSNIKIVKKFEHDGEINRARYMPKDSNIIATINGEGNVSIYDRSKSRSDGLRTTLKYHKENGYGLSFNPNVSNELISGSDDFTIALWDIDSGSKSPKSVWDNIHSDIVNDCSWHHFDENLFGSVSEDSTLKLHDKRSTSKVINTIQAKAAFNTLAFSKHSANLFAAAGLDTNIYLYDRRQTTKPLHVMAGHEDAITCLQFHPKEDGILVSGGADRRVILWDLAEIGAEQQPDEADDGSPEILMIHAGHRSAINDFTLHPTIPWLSASVEEDNVVQVWKCSKNLSRVGGTPEIDTKMLQ